MVERGGHLAKSPLVYVLASIRFAPWPLMKTKLPEIQDALRDIAPLMHTIRVQAVGSSGQPLAEDATATSWVLIGRDRSLAILISEDQLLVLSSNYRVFKDFQDILSKCLSVLFEKMTFIDVTASGIRYIDRITPMPNETLAKYLQPSQLPAQIEGLQSTGGVIISHYAHTDANVRVRCISQSGVPNVPEDLLHFLAVINEPGKSYEARPLAANEGILDIDAYKSFESPTKFESKESLLDNLRVMHATANLVFRHDSICSDYAFKVWKGDSING